MQQLIALNSAGVANENGKLVQEQTESRRVRQPKPFRQQFSRVQRRRLVEGSQALKRPMPAILYVKCLNRFLCLKGTNSLANAIVYLMR